MPGGLALRRDREKRRDLYRRNVLPETSRHTKSKGSSESSLRSRTHVYRTGAGGGGTAWCEWIQPPFSRRERGRVGKNPMWATIVSFLPRLLIYAGRPATPISLAMVAIIARRLNRYPRLICA